MQIIYQYDDNYVEIVSAQTTIKIYIKMLFYSYFLKDFNEIVLWKANQS